MVHFESLRRCVKYPVRLVLLSAVMLGASRAQTTDQQLYETTSRFISYNLHFRTDQRVFEDTLTCDSADNFNITNRWMEDAIDYCASPTYRPRLLSASQITWKPVDKNETASPPKRRNAKKDTDPKNGTFVIHNYFGLALLLPDHPFSADLSRAVTAVGAIFPTVTFSIGNGYEFSDLCMQYGVHSFPKLLFFKNGILTETYRGQHDLNSVAAQVSKWTKQLPRAIPLTREATTVTTARPTIFERNTLDPKMDPVIYMSSSIMGIPFISDRYVFFSSAAYCTLRFMYLFVYCKN